jgi:hypothetical protein
LVSSLGWYAPSTSSTSEGSAALLRAFAGGLRSTKARADIVLYIYIYKTTSGVGCRALLRSSLREAERAP